MIADSKQIHAQSFITQLTLRAIDQPQLIPPGIATP